MTGKTHYEVLDVSPDAPLEEIRRTYKLLVLQCHPDKNLHESARAHRIFNLIHNAYSILSDEKKRHEYDATLRRNNPAQKLRVTKMTVGAEPGESKDLSGGAGGVVVTRVVNMMFDISDRYFKNHPVSHSSPHRTRQSPVWTSACRAHPSPEDEAKRQNRAVHNNEIRDRTHYKIYRVSGPAKPFNGAGKRPNEPASAVPAARLANRIVLQYPAHYGSNKDASVANSHRRATSASANQSPPFTPFDRFAAAAASSVYNYLTSSMKNFFVVSHCTSHYTIWAR